MNISSRCEYACRAIVELALHEPAAQPYTVERIAESRHVPEKFLVHILLQLKRAGIVRSVRGARGGYLLARTPDDITLLDIVRAVDGPVLDPLPVKDADDLLAKLEAGKHGLIIHKGYAGATFLPAVWEELPEKEEFLANLCMKAGLRPDEWKNAAGMKFEVYEAEEFGEE